MSGHVSVAISRTELNGTQATDAGLLVHRANPLNAETTLGTLNGAEITPVAQFYVRNHFPVPDLDAADWRLTVAGAVHHPLIHTLRDLHTMPSRTLVVTLECAGNNRTSLSPPVPGEQWRLGAASTAKWTGVPLNDVLDRAKPTSRARNVVFRGADRGEVDGHAGPVFFERGLSLEDISEAGALLAYQMNGAPLSRQHGYPLRLIVPGWYGVASVKWLTEIEVIDHDFEGYFQVQRYRYTWLRDGRPVTEPVRLQRVRSIVTEPTDGQRLACGDVTIRGLAWSGTAPVSRVQVRVGEGPWQNACLLGQLDPHGWRRWEIHTVVDERGITTVQARATDLAGHTQPSSPEWNVLGYGANSIQTVQIELC